MSNENDEYGGNGNPSGTDRPQSVAGGAMSQRARPKGRHPLLEQVTRLYLVHAHSPIHVGVGEGLGNINLPIIREVHTDYPFIPGSSIKGILRDAAEQGGLSRREIFSAFGPPKEHAGDARGGLVISDGSLLCLPVRSLLGTFAWTTCPLILKRLEQDAREAGLEVSGILSAKIWFSRPTPYLVTRASVLVNDKNERSGHLFIEDAMVPRTDQAGKTVWDTSMALDALAAWIADKLWPGDEDQKRFFVERLLLVPDEVFNYFHRYATEVRSRVKIDPERGTAANSGSWNEEYLPAETVLFGVAIGRTTVYIDRDTAKASSGGDRAEGAADQPGGMTPATEPRTESRDPNDVLATLSTLLQGDPLLRVGGKSTGGSGRIHVRIVE